MPIQNLKRKSPSQEKRNEQRTIDFKKKIMESESLKPTEIKSDIIEDKDATKKTKDTLEIKSENVDETKEELLFDTITMEPKTNPPFHCAERVFENNVKNRYVEKGFEIEELMFVKDASKKIKRLKIKLKKPVKNDTLESLRLFNWRILSEN